LDGKISIFEQRRGQEQYDLMTVEPERLTFQKEKDVTHQSRLEKQHLKRDRQSFQKDMYAYILMVCSPAVISM
jgi:hypothetical protein